MGSQDIVRAGEIEDVVEAQSSAKTQSEATDVAVGVQQEDEKITLRLALAFIVSLVLSAPISTIKLIPGQALVFQVICYETTLLILSTILAYIEADLGPDSSYTWIANSWALCAAVVVSIAGRLGDIFGRRYFMLMGSTLSFIGAISTSRDKQNASSCREIC